MNINTFATWYPIALSKNIKQDKVYPIKLLNEPLALFRNNQNNLSCLQDRCAHRSTPLSLGCVRNGNIECPYHGWQFNGEGQCTHIPALMPNRPMPPNAQVPSKNIIEKYGLVWVNMGNASESELTACYHNHFAWQEEENINRYEFATDIELPHELMVENLLDPAHLPFAHDGTLSKRSKAAAIDFTVNKQGSELAGESIIYEAKGEKRQYFHFDAPCTVYFDLNFEQRAMRQVHYCIPLTPDKMRLISIFFYRNFNFFNWIPFMPYIFRRMSRKIVKQDIAMLNGQNNNLKQGALAWNQAINADKLAVAYRRWFESQMKANPPWFAGFADDKKTLRAVND